MLAILFVDIYLKYDGQFNQFYLAIYLRSLHIKDASSDSTSMKLSSGES